MRQGPDKLLRHSVAIILVAIASDAGGLVLFIYGEEAAAFWVMGLSTSIAICETSAFVGCSYLGIDGSPANPDT